MFELEIARPPSSCSYKTVSELAIWASVDAKQWIIESSHYYCLL